jgi:hypothetical protein
MSAASPLFALFRNGIIAGVEGEEMVAYCDVSTEEAPREADPFRARICRPDDCFRRGGTGFRGVNSSRWSDTPTWPDDPVRETVEGLDKGMFPDDLERPNC